MGAEQTELFEAKEQELQQLMDELEQVEVEMIDKVRIGQMLAKSAGLLDNEKEIDKPGVVSIEMVMPKDDGDE